MHNCHCVCLNQTVYRTAGVRLTKSAMIKEAEVHFLLSNCYIATAGRGATPMTDTGKTVEHLKIKEMGVFTSLHMISLCLNVLTNASKPLKDHSHLMRIIKDNICTPQVKESKRDK